jgi:hypothetical protein
MTFDADQHIRAFRFHRGHSACTVEGCTGAQPLMWVPTADEGGEVAALDADVIVLSEQVKVALENIVRRTVVSLSPAWPTAPGHIHWTPRPSD